MPELTQELVKELFQYRDGNLYWKVSKAKRIKIGDKVGSLNRQINYYQIRINNKLYYSHRLIFLYHHGYLPKYIDHIDRDRNNNLIENLRESTQLENRMNSKSFKNSISKYKGVTWDKATNKWKAQIGFNRKNINLGRFINENDATKAYNTKAIELFGKYVKLNKIGDK